MIKDKRAYELGDVQGIVLMLVIIAFLFGAGLYVTSQFQTHMSGTDTVYNETLAAAKVSNVTAFQVANPTGIVNILWLENATGVYDPHTVETQYKFNVSGQIIVVDGTINATALNVTYTHEIYNFTSYQAVGNVTTGIMDLATWIPIIIVIIAAAIIIGIVIRSFGGQKVD